MVTTRNVTVEEFAAMPLEGVWELIDGEPVEMMATGGESGWTSGILFAELLNHVRSRELGWVFPPETGFVLFPDRDTVRSPDAAFVAGDRLERPPKGFIPLAPDLAVEVLSPSDRMADALGKVAMYLEAGVRLVWLVDPERRTVSIFSQYTPPFMLRDGDTLSGGDVLPEFARPISEILG
jgi:Uma2 family endonuclease